MILARADAELLGEVLDRDAGLDLDRSGRHLGLALDLRPGAAAVALLPGAASGLRVDHDPPPAGRRGAALRTRLARGLARLLRRAPSPLPRTRADVVVVDELVLARAGAGLVKLLLDLGLGDALLAGDIGNAAFCHSVPVQFFQTPGGCSTRIRSSNPWAASRSHPQPPRQGPWSNRPADAGRLRTHVGPAAAGAAGRRRRRWCRRAPPAGSARPWGVAGRSRRTA